MGFSWRALLAALVLPYTAGASDRFARCLKELTLPKEFWTGAVTDGGLTPDAYFRDKTDKRGRPRYVLLIGAPGAGKSTWARAAAAHGWTLIIGDDERLSLLAEWRARGREVTNARGERVLADPGDGSQYWDDDVVVEMIARTQKKTRDALQSKVPIVVESAGPHLIPFRAARMSQANHAGYAVEGLAFNADGAKSHIENTRLRHQRGGTAPMPALVTRRFDELAYFGSPFRVRPRHVAKEVLPEVIADFDWLEALPDQYATVEEALAKLPAEQGTKLRRYLDEDVFHRLDFVWVPTYR